MTRSAVLVLASLAACGGGSSDADSTDDAPASGDDAPLGSTGVASTGHADDTHAEVSSSDASTTPPASSEGSSGDADGTGSSMGCGNPDAMPGESLRSLMIQGQERTFIVDAPATIATDTELALVFVFHGNGGNGQASQGMGLQLATGAQDQAVFVFPDGIQYMSFGVGWNGACEEYDMELFDQMIASLSAEYCIDVDRIFAAGFSWGGDMCQALACCRGETVRAIAPASGPEFFPSIYPEACPDTDRPAFRMTYATNDAYPPQMFADTIEWHRTQQSCSNDAIDIDPPPCIAYEGCEDPVIACEYEGLGHAWPSDWAESTWSFFSQLH